jgi:hypothetical protein
MLKKSKCLILLYILFIKIIVVLCSSDFGNRTVLFFVFSDAEFALGELAERSAVFSNFAPPPLKT